MLVVIDPQTKFLDQRHTNSVRQKSVQSIVKTIKEFRKRNHLILLIKYKTFGPFVPEIYESLRGYPNVVTMSKNYDNGGHLVINAVNKYSIPIHEPIYVAGAYIGACVTDTMNTFMHVNPHHHVIFIADATLSNAERARSYSNKQKIRNILESCYDIDQNLDIITSNDFRQLHERYPGRTYTKKKLTKAYKLFFR